MMRRLLQPFWVLLAVIFLIEAWLWDHLEPIVERIVARIPLRAFKQWLSERVDTLSPAMTLIVFAVPVIPLFPLKLVGLWLLANEYWLSAVIVIVFGKLVGVGVTAFIFDVTRTKLLHMAWFKKTRKPIASQTAEKPSRVPEGLWVKCPGCTQLIYNKDLEASLNVCPKCAHHFRIGAAERLASLFDDGKYDEHFPNLISTDPLQFVDTKPYRDRLHKTREATGL